MTTYARFAATKHFRVCRCWATRTKARRQSESAGRFTQQEVCDVPEAGRKADADLDLGGTRESRAQGTLLIASAPASSFVRHFVGTAGMAAIAHQLDCVTSVMTVRTAILLARCDVTVARRVRAFHSVGHGVCLLIGYPGAEHSQGRGPNELVGPRGFSARCHRLINTRGDFGIHTRTSAPPVTASACMLTLPEQPSISSRQAVRVVLPARRTGSTWL
jgi:hypothetical protein